MLFGTKEQPEISDEIVAYDPATLARRDVRKRDVERLFESLVEAGRRMLAVYVPYALVVLAAFAVRAAPSVDVRSLTSTLVFGPFLFARPLVVAAGVAWGLAATRRADASALLLVVLAEMLLLERLLVYMRSRRAAARGG